MRRIAIAISRLAAALAALAMAAALAGCGGEEAPKPPNPVAEIEMESGLIMRLELYPDAAPQSVGNFLSLAGGGFYDGLSFHRVIAGFMVQGGCPKGDGTGDAGYSIKGEFAANGFRNDVKHSRGVISMARSPLSYDGAGSQFFIVHADSPHLDGNYAAFGRLVGEDSYTALDSIALAQTDVRDKPLSAQIIKKVTVDAFGAEYSFEKIR